jgi:23S rRNA (uridine2552-2'-O)-methyltransferase
MVRKRGSSQRWLREHERDPYVQRARREGRIARSAYKLAELDQRDKLLRSGMVVVDLGAAPGGWSQHALERVGDHGRVIALDLLPLELSVPEFIQADIEDEASVARLHEHLRGDLVNLVMSDMAPNFSGMRAVDQPRSMALAELARDFALEVLEERGKFLVKVFQGEGFDMFKRSLHEHFKRVLVRKPQASRDRSRELYLLAAERKVPIVDT